MRSNRLIHASFFVLCSADPRFDLRLGARCMAGKRPAEGCEAMRDTTRPCERVLCHTSRDGARDAWAAPGHPRLHPRRLFQRCDVVQKDDLRGYLTLPCVKSGHRQLIIVPHGRAARARLLDRTRAMRRGARGQRSRVRFGNIHTLARRHGEREPSTSSAVSASRPITGPAAVLTSSSTRCRHSDYNRIEYATLTALG